MIQSDFQFIQNNHTFFKHLDLSIQFRNESFNFRTLWIFPAVVFLLAVDFDFIQLNSFPFMTNILLYVMKKIYTWLSLLERFPPPLSLISSFLQGSVLKQNTSLMQKIRNSCLSYFSTRSEAVLDQAVLDSNRPIYVKSLNSRFLKMEESKQSAVTTINLWTEHKQTMQTNYIWLNLTRKNIKIGPKILQELLCRNCQYNFIEGPFFKKKYTRQFE